jgi:hypothetical protein
MLSQFTLSHAATRTANAKGDSAQNPIAPWRASPFKSDLSAPAQGDP